MKKQYYIILGIIITAAVLFVVYIRPPFPDRLSYTLSQEVPVLSGQVFQPDSDPILLLPEDATYTIDERSNATMVRFYGYLYALTYNDVGWECAYEDQGCFVQSQDILLSNGEVMPIQFVLDNEKGTWVLIGNNVMITRIEPSPEFSDKELTFWIEALSTGSLER